MTSKASPPANNWPMKWRHQTTTTEPEPETQPRPDDLDHAQLLAHYLDPDIPPRELADIFGLSLPQLAAWADSQRTRADIHAINALQHARAADLAPSQLARARHTLAAIAATAPGARVTALECRANETARRAATKLLTTLSPLNPSRERELATLPPPPTPFSPPGGNVVAKRRTCGSPARSSARVSSIASRSIHTSCSATRSGSTSAIARPIASTRSARAGVMSGMPQML